MERLVSGIKPTGELTLGSYIGAIKQYIELQKKYESYVFVADLHAITVPQEKEELRKNIKDIVAIYLACGLDHKKTTIYLQSENPYHAQLSWILECNTYLGELNRMTQFKDKNKKSDNKSLSCGLYTYPVLMSSDILLYDADIVPVGEDQKQHVELTRNIAQRFNNKYGETFKIPRPVIPAEGARIKDLQDPLKKMSKSDDDHRGSILLLDKEDVVRKKIMGAITDSYNKIYFDEENKPGISNLMTIYGSLCNMKLEEVEEKFKDSNYGTFKKEVADVIVETLEPIQKRYKDIISSSLIDEVLDEGLAKVIEIARTKCLEVQERVGLGR
ncbi:MAG: tryptophan--tRNA ligase [Bacilli bacterium]|nr:tryptophan--tRNA ligase [Bacilli bacterium]MDD3304551.1 tryptophan--tRNA ligase [Bacilli bacterium]MDD4053833.1 tryptophan--tRNA ligase [Bacilli bacterium]MDD4411300.1 tryptophan--tRNA ligase [Bacilli bacterium]